MKKISLNREPSLEVLENWKEMNADEKKWENFRFSVSLGRESLIIQDPFKMPHGFQWTFFSHVKSGKQWIMKRRRQSPRKDDSRLVLFFSLYFGFIFSICGSKNSIVLCFVSRFLEPVCRRKSLNAWNYFCIKTGEASHRFLSLVVLALVLFLVCFCIWHIRKRKEEENKSPAAKLKAQLKAKSAFFRSMKVENISSCWLYSNLQQNSRNSSFVTVLIFHTM